MSDGSLFSPLSVANDLSMSERNVVEYIIYTDGGCSVNNKLFNCPGAYAFIVAESGDVEIGRECKRIEQTTNNRMELYAAIEGLRWLIKERTGLRSCDCTVITDSKYLRDGYHEYLPEWKKNGWRKSDGRQVMNLDLWRKLSELSPEFSSLRFQWVRGHANHRQNCEVDTMVHDTLYGRKVAQARVVEKVLSDGDPEMSDIVA